MEEKKEKKITPLKKAEKKEAAAPQITPEMLQQLQAMLQQSNERTQQIVAQARQLEQMLRDRTLDHMFNVLKYAHEFTPDFVGKCADAITAYISNVAFSEEDDKEEIKDTHTEEVTE